MSCYSDDVHNVYIDGELPYDVEGDYLKHIATCPVCKGKVEELRAIRGLFDESRGQLKLSRAQKDIGYSKMLLNMRYRENSRLSNRGERIGYTQVKRMGIPFAVAAAVMVCAVGVTLRMNGNGGTMAVPQSVAVTNSAPMKLSDIMVSGELSDIVSSGAMNSYMRTGTDKESYRGQVTSDDIMRGIRTNIVEVDHFRPDFAGNKEQEDFQTVALPNNMKKIWGGDYGYAPFYAGESEEAAQ